MQAWIVLALGASLLAAPVPEDSDGAPAGEDAAASSGAELVDAAPGEGAEGSARAEAESAASELSPVDVAAIQRAAWERDDRRLRIQTGVSGGLALGFVGVGLALVFAPVTCAAPDPEFGCGEGYGRLYTSFVLFAGSGAAAIAMAAFGARLGLHRRSRPRVTAALAPGGIELRF
ncbi:MAG: hypothetical protein R3A79_08350 [Nannocystaceae bacterium]